MVDVSLTRCADYEEKEVTAALLRVLEPLGGLSWVTPGMKIIIKANLVAYKKPDAAATTHPALLCALVRELVARGASVVIGDSPGGIYNSIYVNRIYSGTGMHDTEKAGAVLNQDFTEAECDLPDAVIAKHIRYTAYLDHADAIINFCKLKTHGMMGMSAAAKNMFGVIPGSVKPEYHYLYPNPMDFARMIVDLDSAFPARLCLVDAVIGMEGNGPTAGTPRPIGCLLASCDPHRLDMVCAKIIGLSPEQIPTLMAARERGLIPASPDEVTTSEPPEPYCIPDYKNIPNAAHLSDQDGNKALWGGVMDSLMHTFIAPRPALTREECIGCRECEKVCPAKAIIMQNGKPVIDRKSCIRCFCCQEFCPKGAMKVRRPVIARFLDSI